MQTGVFKLKHYIILIFRKHSVGVIGHPSLGNVAYNKPTVQTADWSGQTSDRAVDGITDATTCAGTAKEESWWRVDLGQLHMIYNVTIYTQARMFVTLCKSTKAHWYQG